MRSRKRKRNQGSELHGSPYDLLLERILLGEYPPGTSLVEQDIANELGVSRTPVREALLRLKVEKLVKIVPRGGIFVAEATLRLIREVTETRLVLEEFLAHLVVKRRSEPWLKQFQSWLLALEPSWKTMSARDWMRKDAEFHNFLNEAAGNEVLSNHLNLLRCQAVLFWGQSKEERATLEPVIADFRETLDAVTKRDVGKCVKTLHGHILAHVDRLQGYMKPEVFSPRVATR